MNIRPTLLATLAVGALVAGACSGDADTVADVSDETPEESSDNAAEGSLADVCPGTVVIQTDWYATPERAAAYELAGPGGEIDSSAGTYTGALGDTGVEVEVRLGGPFIGFQPVSAQMYQDTSVTLGYVPTDEAIELGADLPTTAVVAPLDVNPQVVMWDPENYDIGEWSDVVATGATITYLEGLPFMDYLVAEGYVDEGQLDASFDGTPSRFVAEGGAIIQQGYASNEPYRWEHDVEDWMKPVDYLLVHDSGYEIYPQGLAVRSDELEQLSPCLEQLVPLIQQAQIDYAEAPEATNATLVEIAEAIGDGPPITADANAAAVTAMIDLGLIGNGPDDTIGDFDMDRVDETIELLRPILSDRGTEVLDGLTAETLVTNEFIDNSIGL